MRKHKLHFATVINGIVWPNFFLLFVWLLLTGCRHSNPRTFSLGLQREVVVINLPSGPGPELIKDLHAVSVEDIKNAIINSLQDIGFSKEPGLPPCSDLDPLPMISSNDVEFCSDVHELQRSEDPILKQFNITGIRAIRVPTDDTTYYGVRFRGRWTAEEQAPSRFQLNPSAVMPGPLRKSPQGFPKKLKSPKVTVTLEISVVLYYRGYASSFVLYPDTHYDSKSMLDGIERMIRKKLKETAGS